MVPGRGVRIRVPGAGRKVTEPLRPEKPELGRAGRPHSEKDNQD